MQRWEYKFVSLYLGEGDVGLLDDARYEIAQLGKDGWEAVGQIEFLVHPPNTVSGYNTRFGEIILKRPLVDGGRG